MLVWRGFYLSIALHLLILAILALLPKPIRHENVSIDFINVPTKQQPKFTKTIVRDQLLPDSMKKEQSQDPWRFLSEKTQSVKEQTRALQSGMTKNRSSSANTQKQQKVEKPQKMADLLPGKISIPTPKQYQSESEKGISTFGNDLPVDIKVGEITALNTDRYLFYSYFARAEELLRHEWEPMVTTTLERPPASLQASIHRRFTSVVEIWFYPGGKYHSSHLMKPSGVAELDRAAVESFRLVGMIPNPPKERIEKDGLVRFQWSLTVEYSPKVLVHQ